MSVNRAHKEADASRALDGQADETADVAAARGGDTAAFERLLRRHADAVFSFLVRWLGDESAAQDVFQEAGVKTFQTLPSLREAASFRAWYFRVAINEAKQFRRANRRLRDRHWAAFQVAATTSRGPSPERLDATRMLEVGLALVSEDHRRVLLLRFVEELSHEEIALALDVPVFVVKMRVSRARKAFKRALEAAQRREDR